MVPVIPWHRGALAAVLLTAAALPALAAQEPGVPPPGPSEPLPAGAGDAVPDRPAEPLAPPAGNGSSPDRALDLDSAGLFPGGFSPLANPLVGHLEFRADYRLTWFPDEPVAGQATHLGYLQNNFVASFPVWQDCCDEWSAFTGVRGEFFQTGTILPDTRQPFPDELWDIRFGTSYRHLFDNGWISGGTLSLGSASDQPFHSLEELTAGVNWFLRIPQGEHNAWLFSLNYSTTSELPFPVPGVAYIYQPTDWFRVNIGLPFQLVYRPLDELTLDLSYMLLRTVHARASYRLARAVRIYVGFDWSNEAYFLVDRPSENDRFFYYDKRLTSGVQVFLGRQATLDLFGGYTFDRFYFEGASYSDRDFNRINVGNGPFLGLRFDVRF